MINSDLFKQYEHNVEIFGNGAREQLSNLQNIYVDRSQRAGLRGADDEMTHKQVCLHVLGRLAEMVNDKRSLNGHQLESVAEMVEELVAAHTNDYKAIQRLQLAPIAAYVNSCDNR